MPKEVHDSGSAIIRDLILGGQDGLVNVLSIVLAVAEATRSKYVILIAGLAATFAESISMAAVAYTSGKAGKEYYAERRREIKELAKKYPAHAKQIVNKIFMGYKFKGTFFNKAVQYVMKDKKRLSAVLTHEEVEHSEEFDHPVRDSIIVGIAAIFGSLIPLVPFFVIPISTAIWYSLALSTIVLFVSGAVKAQFTAAKPLKSGIEMAVVGITAAVLGFLIGKVLGFIPV